MAISRIGSGTGTTSATLPAHQVGDLILIAAYRDGNNAAPSLPSGYINITSVGANTNSMILGYKLATTTSETSGTWTNATSVIAVVYRGATIGGFNSTTGSGTSISYPTVTMVRGNNTSWVAGFGGHRSTNIAIETAPSGMTNITSVSDATDEMAAHDTNATVSSWTATSASVGGTTSGWASITVELLDKRALSLVSSQGTFNETGQAVTLRANRLIAMAQSSFTLSGQALTLKVSRLLGVAQASFSLSGQSTTLRYAKTLLLLVSTFALSGQSATLRANRNLTASQNSYALSGQSVTLKKAVLLSLTNTSISLNRQSVGLYKTTLLTVSKRDYTLSGQSVGVTKASTIAVAKSDLNLNGQTASLKKASRIISTYNQYNITGENIGLTYQQMGAYSLLCNKVSYTYSGQSIEIYKQNRLQISRSNYEYSFASVNFQKSNRLNISVVQYNFNYYNVLLDLHKTKRRYFITS